MRTETCAQNNVEIFHYYSDLIENFILLIFGFRPIFGLHCCLIGAEAVADGDRFGATHASRIKTSEPH